MRIEDFDLLDILHVEIVVTDQKGKKHRKETVYCKADHDEDISHVLRKLKIKSAKSIEIIPIKKIGHKNEGCIGQVSGV